MKKILSAFMLTVLGLGLAFKAQAVCPICIVGVGAGLGLSRYLGIDDIITSLWLGGLLVALSLWTISWLNKKNIRFRGRKIIVFVAYYGLTAVSLWPFPQYTHIGHPYHMLWGVDKIVLGIIIGTIFFALGDISYLALKKRNNNRAHFPFQKVLMPIAPLIILSFIFYFITRK